VCLSDNHVHEEEGFLELLCFVVGPNLVEISEKFHGAPNFPRLGWLLNFPKSSAISSTFVRKLPFPSNHCQR
jgi:hypothetical protein